jgi:LysM repeat protein
MALCPRCGYQVRKHRQSELCPACGARLQADQESCPICSAQRLVDRPPTSRSIWGLIAGSLSVAAFVGAIWLTRPWSEISSVTLPTLTPTPSATLRPTAAPTPTETSIPTSTALPGPTPTPAPTSAYVLYTVTGDDTLMSVAVRFGIAITELLKLNDLPSTASLSRGQQLVVPRSYPQTPVAVEPLATPTTQEPLIHVVVSGDLLTSIAGKYDVTSEDIARANNISVNAILSIGQKLVIPGKQASATSRPTATLAPTSTQTPTPEPSPTRAPTSPFPYRAPQLLAPPSGSSLAPDVKSVVLNWTSVGVLSEREWYLLRVWRSVDDAAPLEAWTKATSWRVLAETSRELSSAKWSWQVLVALRADEEGNWIALSPASPRYEFTWR